VSISGDGRFVVFDAHRADLVPGDTNNTVDVFVYDRTSKTLSRASVGSDGHEGNGVSDNATITPDGRYVAFWSNATNLVPGDTNGLSDVFLHDRQTGVTERVSVDVNRVQIPAGYGNPPPALSSDARYVAFVTPTGALNGSPYFDVLVRDRVAHVTLRINTGSNGASAGIEEGGVSLSADGRYVAFASRSSNLVPGDTNTFPSGPGAPDVFVHDRATGEVEIASVRSNGLQLPFSGAPSLSADGRLVAFFSYKLDFGRTNESVYVHELGGTSIWGYRIVGGSDFGAQSIGTTSTARNYSVQNTGAVALPIERVELRGTDAAQFVLDSRCGTTLAVGGKCNVKVSFAPKTVGAKTAKLAVVFAS
jgi:Tol biopolymer transport system component